MPTTTLLSPPQRLADPQPMRRGSVGERYMKCSRPGCACADDVDARHGPYRSLTYAVAGKTRSRYLSPEQEVIARRQIEAGRQFQHEVEDYWESCTRLADQQLDGSSATPDVAEKGGSRRASARRLKRKSAG